MPLSSVSKWDNSPAFTNDMSIVTSALDFGDASITKKVTAVNLSFISESALLFGLGLSYRTQPSGSYTSMGAHVANTTNGFSQTFTLSSPVSCNYFQLKIDITCAINQRVGINDISILHRKLRKYSSETKSTD